MSNIIPVSMRIAIAKYIFQNIGIANVGDATGLRPSAVAGSLYWSLHSANPGEAGTQVTSEISYTGYARLASARSSAGFAVDAATGAISNAAVLTWGTCTAGTATATHWGVGYNASGAGSLVLSGALNSSLVITTTTNSIVSAAIGALISNHT